MHCCLLRYGCSKFCPNTSIIFKAKKEDYSARNPIKKAHAPKFHTNYKIVSWLDNELPDVTVTITSGKSTYRFTGSYDGDHALTSKLLSHMVNDVSVKHSKKG